MSDEIHTLVDASEIGGLDYGWWYRKFASLSDREVSTVSISLIHGAGRLKDTKTVELRHRRYAKPGVPVSYSQRLILPPQRGGSDYLRQTGREILDAAEDRLYPAAMSAGDIIRLESKAQ